MVDIGIIRHGCQLSSADAELLVRPITWEEINHGLFSIEDSKAPGIDGYNALFFKKNWHLLGRYIVVAV